MTTGLRECCALIMATIGPTPVEYRPLPRTTSEIRKYLKAAMKLSDAEKWHQTQLDKVATRTTLEGTDFRKIVQEVGAWFLKGCKGIEHLKFWAENGVVPNGFYNERHLLNTTLSHIKSAFEAMEIISKSYELKRADSAARPIALQYYVQVYLLLLVLTKVAYGKEFDEYFQEWYNPLADPDWFVEFDTLDPTLYTESDIRNISLATVLPPANKVPLRDFPFRDPRPQNIPRAFPNQSPYGKASLTNTYVHVPGQFPRGDTQTITAAGQNIEWQKAVQAQSGL